MLYLVINLIHQRIPIDQLLATFLKIRTLRNILQQHRMNVECIIGTNERNDALEMTASSFFDGGGEGFVGFALAIFDVGFLSPESGARHVVVEWGRRRGGVGVFGTSRAYEYNEPRQIPLPLSSNLS